MLAGSAFQRPPEKYPFWSGTDGALHFQHVPNRLLDVFGRWDTMFYVDIATRGYGPLPAEGWNYHAAFFPLMPALMRGLSELAGCSPFVAGIVISNVLLWFAAVGLLRLVTASHGAGAARLAVIGLLCFPVTTFFSVPYAESLALFLAVLAFNAAREGRNVLSGLAVALALLARPNGWILAVAIALAPWPRRAVRISIAAAGLLVLLVLQRAAVGETFYFLRVQEGWGRTLGVPFLALFSTARSADHHVFALLGIGLAVLMLVRRRFREYWLFSVLNLLLPLSTGSLQSSHRFVQANFPLWSTAAVELEQRPRARVAVAVVLLVAMCVYAFRWGAAYPPN